jgi:coenzyme F420-reducing hydrogenase delta subunit
MTERFPGLSMDMHSVSHNVKFSWCGTDFCKYSSGETFMDIRENVIEQLMSQFNMSEARARLAWLSLVVERG